MAGGMFGGVPRTCGMPVWPGERKNVTGPRKVEKKAARKKWFTVVSHPFYRYRYIWYVVTLH